MEVTNKNTKINIIITACLILILLIRFYFAYKNDNLNNLDRFIGQNVIVNGYIVDEPLTKDFKKTFTVKVNTISDEKVDINIRVETPRYYDFKYSERLILTGKLSIPFNFKSNGGRTFDYVDFLMKDGVYFIMKNPSIEITNHDDLNILNKITFYLYEIKQDFLSNIKRVLGEPHASLAGGLVVGEKNALGKDLIDDFRKTGLIHIVVLSGYNITIIADTIRRLLIKLPRNIGISIGVFGIVMFGILVGGGATVVRSCIMAIIANSANLFRKNYNVGRALFIAGVLMLIVNPLILFYDPSFQLSFLATLGLLFLSSPIESRLGFISEKFGIRSLIASTFATQIFVSPYILYMMGQLSIIGVIVNIVVLPFIPITMLFVVITGAIGFISYFASEITAFISYFLLSYELFIVQNFAKLPFAYIEIPKFSFWIVFAFYANYLIAFLKLPSTFSQFRFSKKSPT